MAGTLIWMPAAPDVPGTCRANVSSVEPVVSRVQQVLGSREQRTGKEQMHTLVALEALDAELPRKVGDESCGGQARLEPNADIAI